MEPHFRRWPLPVAIWLAWFGAMGVTWRYASEQPAIEHAKLSTTAPDCFICSAAARGHPVWVGTGKALTGESRVNLQMQRLKLLEFAVTVMNPRLHCIIRIVYKRVSPRAARLCRRSVWPADVAFVLLKPLEWGGDWHSADGGYLNGASPNKLRVQVWSQ